MKRYAHLTHQALLSRTASALHTRCVNTAEVLGCLAEVEERELHVAAGYDSMFSYCVHFFEMSEGSARKFIRATRAVREFPATHAGRPGPRSSRSWRSGFRSRTCRRGSSRSTRRPLFATTHPGVRCRKAQARSRSRFQRRGLA